ncbi:uncharacterized protein LOC132149789 [Carassius carassius]|uniref:uncharacterized protein LOC132149789 n=1 Tax=Carassius carassius TaxID=217509 RepID=UPI0028696E3B|nr:uncharacterized protein LOC132149789 [Carassius carassius]
MGKCKFQLKWLENENFKTWLQPVSGKNDEGFCGVCRKAFKLGTMGIGAVKSHMQGDGHKSAVRAKQQTTMSSYFGVTDKSTSNNVTTTTDAVTTVCGAANITTAKSSDIRSTFGSNATLQAEVLWCLNTAVHHHSYASNEGVSELFQAMFPDSEIVKSFSCGKDKTSYILKFGLAPYFKNQLITAVNNAGPFVLMFDESLNHSTKNKQLDVHVRFWEAGCVQSRYLGSQFMGHSKSEDLLHHFKKCVHLLDLKHLISISMDGPNVNFKFLNNLQQEHGELHGGRQLILVGSCGLHTVHNSFKTGLGHLYLGHHIQWGMPPLLKPACNVHTAPLSFQVNTALTPIQKQRTRGKRALQYAVSIYDSDTFPVTPVSTEIAHASPQTVKSTDVILPRHTTSPEKIKSAADISIPVKSTPVTPEPVNPAPVILAPVKSVPVVPKPVNPAPYFPNVAKLAAVQSVLVILNSVIPETVTFTTIIQEQNLFLPAMSRSTEVLPRLVASPVVATEAEAFILPVPARQAISKLLASLIAFTDAFPASPVKSTDDPVNQVMSTK